MTAARPIPSRRGASDALLVGIQGFCLLAIIAAGAAYRSTGIPAERLIYPASCLFVAVAALAFVTWRASSGTWFDPYTLFLASTVLFCGGQLLLEVLGLNQDGILAGAFRPQTILETAFLVLFGFASFHLGGLLAAATTRGARARAGAPRARSLASIRRVGWLLVAISIVPASMSAVRAFGVVMSGGYGSLYQQQAATGFQGAPQILAAFLVPGAIFVLAGSGRSAFARRAALFLLLVNAAALAFFGYRYAAFAPLVAFAWVWHRLRRPLPAKAMVATGVVLLCVVFPAISATRSEPGKERNRVRTVVDTFLSIDNPAVAQISEMGRSMVTIAYVVELVPSRHPYDYGAGYYYAGLTLFPNLFWTVHPSIARGSPTEWLVNEVRPDMAAEGGSLGFTFIAEAFLNFGVAGVCLVLMLLGWLYARLVLWAAHSADPLRIAMVGTFLSFVLVFPRADTLSVVRPLVWFAVVPYFLAMLWHKSPPRSAVASAPAPRGADVGADSAAASGAGEVRRLDPA